MRLVDVLEEEEVKEVLQGGEKVRDRQTTVLFRCACMCFCLCLQYENIGQDVDQGKCTNSPSIRYKKKPKLVMPKRRFYAMLK